MEQNYKKACMAYIRAFEEKHGLEFNYLTEDCEFVDFDGLNTLNLTDIRFDIDTNQPSNQIVNWQYAVLDNYSEKGFINYKTWCMGLRYE